MISRNFHDFWAELYTHLLSKISVKSKHSDVWKIYCVRRDHVIIGKMLNFSVKIVILSSSMDSPFFISSFFVWRNFLRTVNNFNLEFSKSKNLSKITKSDFSRNFLPTIRADALLTWSFTFQFGLRSNTADTRTPFTRSSLSITS